MPAKLHCPQSPLPIVAALPRALVKKPSSMLAPLQPEFKPGLRARQVPLVKNVPEQSPDVWHSTQHCCAEAAVKKSNVPLLFSWLGLIGLPCHELMLLSLSVHGP